MGVKLLVVASPDTPELSVLKKLPDGVDIVGIGKTPEQLAEISDEAIQQAEVVLKCGVGDNRIALPDFQKLLWPRLTSLKWIHSASAGVEGVLFPELVDSSVTLTNAKGVYSHSLAEYALTCCNWFAKDLPRMRASQQAGRWDAFEVEELRGHTMGVIGLGDIGKACGRLAKAFHMRVIGLRRNTELKEDEKAFVDKIYAPQEMAQLMSESDYVVAALPQTPATHKAITEAAFAAMQPHAVFVNVGRGSTVDEEALIKVLQDRSIKGAGLDVFYTEPLPDDSPLYKLDNVLMSAHCADRTKTFQFESIETFVRNMEQYVAGKELFNIVDKKSGY